jgi:predicted nucleic acid-binding protein
MNDDRVFIDTNIWIYGIVESKDPSEIVKRGIILSLFETIVSQNELVVSTQILNECHWNLTRKFGYADSEVFNRIEQNIIKICKIMDITQRTYGDAFRIREKFNISFWDSLVVASAMEGGCVVIYTEDMQHNQKLDKLLIKNPFTRNSVS